MFEEAQRQFIFTDSVENQADVALENERKVKLTLERVKKLNLTLNLKAFLKILKLILVKFLIFQSLSQAFSTFPKNSKPFL